MNNHQLIAATAKEMQRRMSGETSGHDWRHAYRVWQTAKQIAKTEPSADPLTVELAALLHDIADYKFTGGDHTVGPRLAREWLVSIGADESLIVAIETIIRSIDFKGAAVEHQLPTIEAKIVFDADKLDALGAIGIARAFMYGATIGEELHDPNLKPVIHTTFEAYKAKKSTIINHFYEKLLHLKSLMQTKEGRRLSTLRHKVVESYLKEFLNEWPK